MENMDVEGTSDIYVIGYVDMKDKQSTDVHFRCQTGAGSFNWRMLLPINTPISGNVLTLQVYDNDLFSSDDYICGAKLNIKNLVTIPKILDVPIKFTREYYNNLTQAEKDVYGQIEFMAADEALLKRVLPHSTEAEQSVIGSMIIDREAITIASEIISGKGRLRRYDIPRRR